MGKTSSGELLQGTLPLLVLRILFAGPSHGFAIARRIQVVSKEVLRAEEGFPLSCPSQDGTRRLDRIGNGGPRKNNRQAKYYRLTASGRKQLKRKPNDGHPSRAISAILMEA